MTITNTPTPALWKGEKDLMMLEWLPIMNIESECWILWSSEHRRERWRDRVQRNLGAVKRENLETSASGNRMRYHPISIIDPLRRLFKPQVLFMEGLALHRAHPSAFHLHFLICASAWDSWEILRPMAWVQPFSYHDYMIWSHVILIKFLDSQDAIIPTTNGWRHQLYTFPHIVVNAEEPNRTTSVKTFPSIGLMTSVTTHSIPYLHYTHSLDVQVHHTSSCSPLSLLGEL